MSELKVLIERLNPTCRRALETAAGLCVAQTNYNVEVEHLLTKLLELPAPDLEPILRYFEIEPTELATQLLTVIEGFKRGNSRTPAMSPEVPHLLEQAWVASTLQLDEPAIRSGAILLALLQDDTLRGRMIDGCPIFTKIAIPTLKEHFGELTQDSEENTRPTPAAARAPIAPGAKLMSETPNLDRYTIDLTAEAAAGRIDPIRGRSSEIRQVIDILTRRRQNNPILVGDAGVGKTAIAEGFALRVSGGDVPPSLQSLAVRILDLGLLQAGAGIKGEFEDRLKNVIEEVKAAAVPVILFIDEAHTLIGAGNMAGQGDAANLLKPALARGELRTIAATTWAEYKKYFEKDAALTRRFQLVRVDEPDEGNAIDMLRGIVPNLQEHHAVRILDEAVRDAVRLSDRFLSERRLPDKAISVLDTACARVALAQEGKPAALEDLDRRVRLARAELDIFERGESDGERRGLSPDSLQSEIEALTAEREALDERWQRESTLVAEIRSLEDKLFETEAGTASASEAKTLENLRSECAELQGEVPLVPIAVDSFVVAEVISGWTGIPTGRMVADEIESVLTLKEQLASRIVGQGHALDTICRRIRTARAGLEDPKKPKAVFMLVGPTGVGKTETALALAEELYGGERNLVTLNMSEFQEAHSVATLKGAPPGYVGYGRGGVLTEAVRRRPYSVVLLDEMEKAHADVSEIFYQVFDKGLLEDGEGVPVDFKNTVILMTSNIGSEAIDQAWDHTGGKPELEPLMERIRAALLLHFRPALLGRLVVVPYFPLDQKNVIEIVRIKLQAIQERVKRNHLAELTYDEELEQVIADRCSTRETGARDIEHLLNHNLLPALSSRILQRMAEGETFQKVHVKADEWGQQP